ncbi:MAG: amidohydrolase family protein [Myxococcota bacterium]
MIAWMWASMAFGADLVVLADEVRPVDGPVISQGAVLVRDGKIAAVGGQSDVDVPEGAVVLRGAVVTPGLVDGLTAAGLTGPYNQPQDQDHDEPGLPVAAALRAVDAYAPWDPLVDWLREHGVTTIASGPSPGSPVGGRTVVTSTAPGGGVRVADGMLVLTLGEAAKELEGSHSRMGSAAEIRQAFALAAEYRARRALPLADRAPVDLALEPLAEALAGERRVVVFARRADDLLTALRLREDLGLDVVLAGATEAYLVRDAIAAAGVPVLVGPPMARAWSSSGEAHNGTFENAALLAAVGVPIGFGTGYEAYVPKVRVVLFEAAIAAANGLGPERALRAATLGGAEILGIADRTGSLTVGKDADLVVFDGDPFEYATHVCTVIVGGQVLEETCR